MMKKYIAVVLICAFFVLLLYPVVTYAAPDISSPKAILIDQKTGQVLYSKNAHEKAFPASTTKIMTAILALERGNLSDYVPISRKASYIDGSRIYLLEGEEVTLEQVLYGLMLESANDSAIAIAEYIGGSVEEFAVMMNDKAKELGALNTNFVNPNGLPDPDHVTTAYDLALIAKHAMNIPKFREIAGTVRYILPETNMQDTRYLYNGNKLIKNTQYKYEGANGIKTGYTAAAKQCFVGSAVRDNMELITVILGESNADKLWKNTIELFDYGFDNFDVIPVVAKDQQIKEIKIKGSSKKVKLFTEEEFHYYAPKGQRPEIKSNVVLDDGIAIPVHNGERLGYIEFTINDEPVGKVRLIAGDIPDTKVLASGVVADGGSGAGSPVLFLLMTVLLGGAAYRFITKKRRRKISYFNSKSYKSLFRRR
jgi:D-alanyl-D-alanine carboxypeptidase (penicillin-binding protein 5/6)